MVQSQVVIGQHGRFCAIPFPGDGDRALGSHDHLLGVRDVLGQGPGDGGSQPDGLELDLITLYSGIHHWSGFGWLTNEKKIRQKQKYTLLADVTLITVSFRASLSLFWLLCIGVLDDCRRDKGVEKE